MNQQSTLSFTHYGIIIMQGSHIFLRGIFKEYLSTSKGDFENF